jgi:predicted nucleic acid-binding protein
VIQVVDASVLVDMLLEKGESGEWCQDRVIEASLAAPSLIHFEVGNLVRRTVVRGEVDRSLAHRALQRLVWMPIELMPFDVLALRAWNLRDNLTTYDACYVATAEKLEVRLVTLDRRLAAAPGLRCDVLVGPAA